MALITCAECGKTFSDKAACCPECACPTEEVLKAIEEDAEKKRVEDEKKRKTTMPQSENESIKTTILDCLTNEPISVTDLIRDNSCLAGYTNQRISALLRQLYLNGDVRISKDGIKDLYSNEKKTEAERIADIAEKERIRKEKEKATIVKMEKDMIEWRDKTEQINSEREKKRDLRIERLHKDIAEKKSQLIRDKEERLSSIERKISDLRVIVDCDKVELEKCSVLDIRKKKELRQSIESNTSKLLKLEGEKTEIHGVYKERMDEIEEDEKRTVLSIEKDLDVEFALPESPEEKVKKEKIEREQEEEEMRIKKTQAENEGYKESILDSLTKTKPVSISYLLNNNPDLSELTSMRISALLRQLVLAGKVEKIRDGKNSLFKLPE